MLGYGDDEEATLEAAVGGPVSDTFGIRVAGRYYDLPDAGYTQLVTGEKIGATENRSSAGDRGVGADGQVRR